MWPNKINSSFMNLFHSHIDYLLVTQKKVKYQGVFTACFLCPLMMLKNMELTSPIPETILLFEIHTLKYCLCLSDNCSLLLPAATLLHVWAVG